jgi:hypothetical protein
MCSAFGEEEMIARNQSKECGPQDVWNHAEDTSRFQPLVPYANGLDQECPEEIARDHRHAVTELVEFSLLVPILSMAIIAWMLLAVSCIVR